MPEIPQDQDVRLSQFLFYFLRLGTIGFGGPIALASRMESDLVRERKWIKSEDYLEGLALAQLAPGPLAAQLAMYLGYVRAGILGATLVALVFVAPSFLMVLAISAAYIRFGGLPWMQAVFYGVGAAVIGIILRSVMKLGRATLKRQILPWTIAACLAVSTAWTGREIFWLFLMGGAVMMIAEGSFPRARSAIFMGPLAAVTGITAGKHAQVFLFFTKASLFVFGSGLAIVPF